MSAETDWINAQLKRLDDAEDEIVAYQIAKDNLELRLSENFLKDPCIPEPEQVY